MKPETRQKQIDVVEYFLRRKWYAKAETFLQCNMLEGYTMTAGRIKDTYGITKNQLEQEKIHYIHLKNPNSTCARKMKCYLIREVEDKFPIKAIKMKKIVELNESINQLKNSNMSLDEQQYYVFDASRELNKSLDEQMDSLLDIYAELKKYLTEIRFQKRKVKKDFAKEDAYTFTEQLTVLEQKALKMTRKAKIQLKLNVSLRKRIKIQ